MKGIVMISLAAELTDAKGRHARGWLFFDGECEYCKKIARWVGPILKKRGIELAPLQDPRVGALLGIRPEQLLLEIRVLLPGNRQSGGADAIVAVAEEIWWARPLVWFSRFPGGLELLRQWYRAIAERRHCTSVSCSVPQPAGRL
jgi:predicted DCC family thiol-disulfide oxidoreductase YuxK